MTWQGICTDIWKKKWELNAEALAYSNASSSSATGIHFPWVPSKGKGKSDVLGGSWGGREV